MAFDSPRGGFESRITRLLRELDLDPSPLLRPKLARFLELSMSWGARMDLTAARSADELVDLALADAAVLARCELAEARRSDQRWVDVGSGGGAPGLPLLLLLEEAEPNLEGALVEPRTRRVAFLRHCVGELGLRHVDVLRCRSDALPSKSFSRAVSRATLPPVKWLAEGARLSKEAVWVLVAREEPPNQPGWFIDRDLSYLWPLTGAPRRALRYVGGALNEASPGSAPSPRPDER